MPTSEQIGPPRDRQARLGVDILGLIHEVGERDDDEVEGHHDHHKHEARVALPEHFPAKRARSLE